MAGLLRAVGTTSGVPVSGSSMIRQGRPETSSTSSAVMTVAGSPSAAISPPALMSHSTLHVEVNGIPRVPTHTLSRAMTTSTASSPRPRSDAAAAQRADGVGARDWTAGGWGQGADLVDEWPNLMASSIGTT